VPHGCQRNQRSGELNAYDSLSVSQSIISILPTNYYILTCDDQSWSRRRHIPYLKDPLEHFS